MKKGSSTSASPKISIIVPTYNRPEMVAESLKSILNQTYQDYEIIVVNDGGVDIETVVAALNEKGAITYVKHGMNRGLAATRNTGIKIANGKYIAYLDDDDVYYPDHLETLVQFLDASEYKVAYTDAHRDHQEMINGKYISVKKDVRYSYKFDYDRILRENFIPVLCIMHDKSCFDAVGLFDEELKAHEDWDLWMRMSRRFKFAHIAKVTCAFSWREDRSTMTSGSKQNMDLSRDIVCLRGKKYKSKDLLSSGFSLISAIFKKMKSELSKIRFKKINSSDKLKKEKKL